MVWRHCTTEELLMHPPNAAIVQIMILHMFHRRTWICNISPYFWGLYNITEPAVYGWWLQTLHHQQNWQLVSGNLPLVFMYLVFTRMPGESYHAWLATISIIVYHFYLLLNSGKLKLNNWKVFLEILKFVSPLAYDRTFWGLFFHDVVRLEHVPILLCRAKI